MTLFSWHFSLRRWGIYSCENIRIKSSRHRLVSKYYDNDILIYLYGFFVTVHSVFMLVIVFCSDDKMAAASLSYLYFRIILRSFQRGPKAPLCNNSASWTPANYQSRTLTFSWHSNSANLHFKCAHGGHLKVCLFFCRVWRVRDFVSRDSDLHSRQ